MVNKRNTTAKKPQRDGKQPQHDGKQPQHDGKQPQHNGKQPPKGASTAGNRCRRKRNTLAWLPRQAFFFILRQPSLTNSCRSLGCPKKKACIAPDIVCPRHCSVEKRYVKESISALLLLCALFSGHLLAHRQGHEYFPVQSLEQQLLHEADSDELRSQHEEAAADLREHHRWQDDRKPRASCQ